MLNWRTRKPRRYCIWCLTEVARWKLEPSWYIRVLW